LGARRKLFKRGVSPIVATLLLILIAIAAAAVLYVWVNNLSSSATQYNSGNVASAISIDAADLMITTANNNVNVTAYVRNIGGSEINGNFNVYVYNQTGALVASGTTGSVSIQPGQVQPVYASLNNTTNIVPEQAYSIKIVAPSGASAVISVTAHS